MAFTSLATASFYLPCVECQLPVRKNTLYDASKKEVDQWSLEYLKPKSTAEREKLLTTQFGLLGALAYPDASHERLVFLNKFLIWIFSIDDDFENDALGLAAMEELTAAYKSVIAGLFPIVRKEYRTKLESFQNLWKEVDNLLTKHQGQRILKYTAHYCDGILEERKLKMEKVVPSTDYYIRQLRVRTSGVMIMFSFIEFAHGLDLPEEVLSSKEIQKLEQIGADHVDLTNDLDSFKKEWESGSYLNILPIIIHNEKCGIQEAVFKVQSMLNALEQEYLEVREKVLNNPRLAGICGVSEYVDGIGYWMSANVAWGRRNPRYNSLGFDRSAPIQVGMFGCKQSL